MAGHIEILLSYRCNLRCVFCSSSELMDAYREERFPLVELIKLLAEKRKQDFDVVNFTGGEPLVYPDMGKLLAFARKIGYKTYISTNGCFLSEDILKDVHQVCLSVHGMNPEMHNLHTGSMDSFDRLIYALRIVESMGNDIFFFTNTVVTRHNLKDIPDIVRFILGYKNVRFLLISNLVPEGSGLENFDELTVTLSDFGDMLPSIMEASRTAGIPIKLFGFPLCILGEHKVCSNDLVYDPRITVELARNNGKVTYREMFFRQPTYQRIKTEKCGGCVYGSVCGGIFHHYYEKFGDNELNPFLEGVK